MPQPSESLRRSGSPWGTNCRPMVRQWCTSRERNPTVEGDLQRRRFGSRKPNVALNATPAISLLPVGPQSAPSSAWPRAGGRDTGNPRNPLQPHPLAEDLLHESRARNGWAREITGGHESPAIEPVQGGNRRPHVTGGTRSDVSELCRPPVSRGCAAQRAVPPRAF